PSAGMGILIDQALYRLRIIPDFLEENGTKQVEVGHLRIKRLPSSTWKMVPRRQTSPATAQEMSASNSLYCKARRTERVSKRLEGNSGQQLDESLLVLEDCPSVYVGGGIPGMAVSERVAAELVTE